MEDDVVSGSHVVDIQKASRVLPRAVDRELLALAAQENELRNQLLRKLVGAIHVVPPGGDARQVIGVEVRRDHHLCPGLRRGVRVRRLKHARLAVRLAPAEALLPVHLVRAHVHEPLDSPPNSADLEEGVRAVHVRHGELEAVAEGVVHVGLGSKVEHGVNVVGLQRRPQPLAGQDIPLDKKKVGPVHDAFQVLQAPAVLQVVQHHHLVLRVPLDEAPRDVRGDKSRAPRYQYRKGAVVPLLQGLRRRGQAASSVPRRASLSFEHACVPVRRRACTPGSLLSRPSRPLGDCTRAHLRCLRARSPPFSLSPMIFCFSDEGAESRKE
mmetsp:Transcript_8257/g.23611  ORF Transcript_8257/g.23611 Transcript_8257/m.23611 type:complete len:325 (+) Transcript_8257:581-1555(+)